MRHALRLIVSALLVAVPALADWTVGTPSERLPAFYDQTFTYSWSAAGNSDAFDISGCEPEKPIVDLDADTDAEVLLYECPIDTNDHTVSGCRNTQQLPGVGGDLPATVVRFSQPYALVRVRKAGTSTGSGTISVTCQNVPDETYEDGFGWQQTPGTGGASSAAVEALESDVADIQTTLSALNVDAKSWSRSSPPVDGVTECATAGDVYIDNTTPSYGWPTNCDPDDASNNTFAVVKPEFGVWELDESPTQAELTTILTACQDFGCPISFPYGSTLDLSTTLSIQKSGVLFLCHGTTFTWSGAAGSPMVQVGGTANAWGNSFRDCIFDKTAGTASEADDAGEAIVLTADNSGGFTTQWTFIENARIIGDADACQAGDAGIRIESAGSDDQIDKTIIQRSNIEGVDYPIDVNSDQALMTQIGRSTRLVGCSAGLRVVNGGVMVDGLETKCTDSGCKTLDFAGPNQQQIRNVHSEDFDDTMTFFSLQGGTGAATASDRNIELSGIQINADCTAPCDLQIFDGTHRGKILWSGYVATPGSGAQRTLHFDLSGRADLGDNPLLDLQGFDELDHPMAIALTDGGSASLGNMTEMERCRYGWRGGDYDPVTGRYGWTCANFNWHGWQDSSQATASYYITCTDAETPDGACLSTDDLLLRGAGVHRVALAHYYTKDGGKGYLPGTNSLGEKVRYVDDGCGTLDDGSTPAECPDPHEPEVEALAHFAERGYTHQVEEVRWGARGTKLIGEYPDCENCEDENPILTGTWLVNDRGNDGTTGPASGARDGPNGNRFIGEWTFGTGWAGTSTSAGVQYCPKAADNSLDCLDEPSFIGTSPWNAWKTESLSPYGVYGILTASIDVNTTVNPVAGCYRNGMGTCTGATDEPCNVDGDCSAGTCSKTELTTSGTCRGDRQIRCWNTTASALRSVGGCVSDTTAADVGPCEGYVDALQYDIETAGKNYDILQRFGACDKDNPTASTDCDDGPVAYPISIKSFDQSATTACVGYTSGEAKEIVIGTRSNSPFASEAQGNGFGFPQRIIWHGGSAYEDRAIVYEPNQWDLGDGGYYDIGFMPADWYGRSTCLSNSDGAESADDEAACDSGSLTATMTGLHGGFFNSVFLNASHVVGKSNHDGDVAAHYPKIIGNKFLYNRRGVLFDAGYGYLYQDNLFVRPQATSGPLGASFNSGLRFIRNRVINAKTDGILLIGATAGQKEIDISDNEFSGEDGSGLALISVYGGDTINIARNMFNGGRGIPAIAFKPGGASDGERNVIRNVNVEGNQYADLGGAGFIRATCSTDGAASGERLESITIRNNSAVVYSTNRVPFFKVDDADANCQVLESLSEVSLENNSIMGRVGQCLFAHGTSGQNCDTATGNVLSSADTSGGSAWGQIAASSNVPRSIGNTVQGKPVPDVVHGGTAAANIPNGSTLKQGTVVTIFDDTTASGTCDDSSGGADGALDGGGTFLSDCAWDGSAWVSAW